MRLADQLSYLEREVEAVFCNTGAGPSGAIVKGLHVVGSSRAVEGLGPGMGSDGRIVPNAARIRDEAGLGGAGSFVAAAMTVTCGWAS